MVHRLPGESIVCDGKFPLWETSIGRPKQLKVYEPMKHSLSQLATILFGLFFMAGCVFEADEKGADVHALEFVFSMNDAVFNGDVASVQFGVPSVTPIVVDQGAVLAYYREQGTWTAMPYTFADESPDLPAVDYTITMGYAYDDGLVEVFYEASTPEAPIELQPDRRVKVVIIDNLNFSSAANLDLNNYEAVKAEFGLKD